MKLYKLHLIRHGMTQGNKEGIYMGGGIDMPLCPEGESEIVSLRAKFDYPKVDTVFCSPLLRTVQTADILYPDVKKLVIEDLRECNFGEFEGKKVSELMVNPDFQKWLDPKSQFTPVGGESGEHFATRTANALLGMFEFMMKSGKQEAVCVTHGGLIMSMLSQCALPRKKAPDWLCDNGCGYTITCTPSMWMRDRLVEATDIVPQGYIKEVANKNDDDEVIKNLAMEENIDFENDPERFKF